MNTILEKKTNQLTLVGLLGMHNLLDISCIELSSSF